MKLPNVNCKFCKANLFCKNENVRRSWWGFGPRYCEESGELGQTCKVADRHKKPRLPPSPQRRSVRILGLDGKPINPLVAPPSTEYV